MYKLQEVIGEGKVNLGLKRFINDWKIIDGTMKIETKRKLSKVEKTYYNTPYPTADSRKPLAVWPKEIPIEGTPDRNYKIIKVYSEWLKETTIPKLLLYAKPGMILKKKDVAKIQQEFKNLESVYIGKGKHYIQEDQPHSIGKAIKNWVTNTKL